MKSQMTFKSECRKGILSGYRQSPCTLKQAIGSAFLLHNETVNIWTHFFGALFLLYTSWEPGFFRKYHDQMNYLLPYCIHMIFSVALPIVSSSAHLFSCLSSYSMLFCYSLDYYMITLYSWSTALAYASYMNMMNDVQMYLGVAVVLTFLTTYSTINTRDYGNSLRMLLIRFGSHSIPYLWMNASILQKWWIYGSSEISDNFKLQLFFLALAGTFYLTALPERVFPGMFDLALHSHNFLHIFQICASYHQRLFIKELIVPNSKVLLQNLVFQIRYWIWLTPLIALVNLIVVKTMSYRLWMEKLKEVQRKKKY